MVIKKPDINNTPQNLILPCYSKSEEMLRYSIQLLIHYLKFADVPTPYSNNTNYCLV
ncbi:IS1 transposase [Dolichospermum compactum NIES-806]|uniref:IS1 transposase n=1 Tax=Dolichospermum compactum NIES-806 TaxID=1973481 RepID=A0A1Z4V2F9_9CYAN|nr:IS1 transposase [Dolichospermum compactum NIES-806]